MAPDSLDTLRGRISAGEYAVDSGAVASEIITKFALVRRVTRQLIREDDHGDAGETAPRGAHRPGSVKNSTR
jgi:hypothetical protein